MKEQRKKGRVKRILGGLIEKKVNEGVLPFSLGILLRMWKLESWLVFFFSFEDIQRSLLFSSQTSWPSSYVREKNNSVSQRI